MVWGVIRKRHSQVGDLPSAQRGCTATAELLRGARQAGGADPRLEGWGGGGGGGGGASSAAGAPPGAPRRRKRSQRCDFAGVTTWNAISRPMTGRLVL